MHLGRSVVAMLWVPVAAVFGPVVALRHGLPQLIGGAVVISMPWVAGWLWQYLDGCRVARRRLRWLAFTAAFVVGLALAPLSYGHADAWYMHHLAHPREVVVARTGCTRVKSGCVYWASLSTPDGARIPLQMYDLAETAKPGQRLVVRWDRLGYASPTPTRDPGAGQPYAGVSPLAPVWVWAGLLGLYLGGSVVLLERALRARHRPVRR
jgi:hypothetical protein